MSRNLVVGIAVFYLLAAVLDDHHPHWGEDVGIGQAEASASPKSTASPKSSASKRKSTLRKKAKGNAVSASVKKPPRADWLFRNATIIDGTGSKGFVGHLAVKGTKITWIGKAGETPPAAGEVLDCTGLVLTPGMIDLHNHSDFHIITPALRGNVNYLMQGCTTVITGNCGFGPVDVAAYYKTIDEAGAGTHVGHLIPHGSMRGEVVGSVQRKATDAEVKKMLVLVEKGMNDGAWGMATGLIYVPGTYTETAELIEVTKPVGKHGGIYASHIRSEGTRLLESVDEAITIGRRAGCPVHISHFKSSGRDAWGLIRQATEQIEQARKKGEKVTADQYPYIASSTSLEATIVPTWARSGGHKQFVARLDDPKSKNRLVAEIAADLEKADGGANLFIARYTVRPEWAGKNIRQIAETTKRPALDVALEMLRAGNVGIVNFNMNEEDVRFAMQRPWVATASDGRAYLPGADRPHPRSYGTFSRKIARYAIAEKVISLEQAVRSATGLPAEILGLSDRGVLKPGMAADITVFDPKTFQDAATFAAPHQYSTGVRYVFVDGTPAVYQGLPTGALAGKALRKRPAMPSSSSRQGAGGKVSSIRS